jgi:hypothetical protein
MKTKHFTFSVPLIGHMYLLKQTPVEVLMDHHTKYGDVFLPCPLPTGYLCNYEDIKQAMKEDIM